MKKSIFLTAFILSLAATTSVYAVALDNPFSCNEGTSFIYNDDGTVTVTQWGNSTTYDSTEDAYTAVFGFVPPLTIEESGYASLVPGNSNNNNTSGSNKHRGRLINTVQEATEAAKDVSENKDRLRYK